MNRKVYPKRMKILFVTVFFLFSMLIVRLGMVQIVNGQSYEKVVEKKESLTVNSPVPRGEIYDRNGKLIVGNKPQRAITYTRTSDTSQEELRKVSKKLADMIDVNIESLTERDKKDFWIWMNPSEADKKVSASEVDRIQSEKGLSTKEANQKIYQLMLERISEREWASFTREEYEMLAIYQNISKGYALSPQIVKNKGVSITEYAQVSAHLDELPGVNVTTDWTRSYPLDHTLRSVLGDVSSTREGIPKDLLQKYLAEGYDRNDRVGTSYLELKYEDLLNGQKKKVKNIIKDGQVIGTKVIQKGHSGKDLVLSIDVELQKEIEKIIQEELSKHIGTKGSPYLDRAFVVMMDPYTGEIEAMVGQKVKEILPNGEVEFQDYSLGTYTTSYESGSVVKGATLLTGYMTNQIKPGERIVDEPLYIKGTPKKASWFNEWGQRTRRISDLFALEKSSNSYMWKVALRIAGSRYVPEAPIQLKGDAFRTFREHFAQMGLGVPTGIDLPGESPGYQGTAEHPGLLLDFAIGQYDTYTPMQLAQYVSAIANGGERIQPHLLKGVREPSNQSPSLGSVVYKKEPEVLNRIDASRDEIHQVQKGFYRVFHGREGTANLFKDASYNAAGKSGTAEAFYKGPNMKKAQPTYNTSLIGYAPFDQPEIAFATVVPWSHQKHDPYINKTISKRVMDTYFE
ncbi:cell elongation-specific peptidoglycan D,D-transpeptidase [Rossellomorea aquimaris]|uniref:serine-type D-Ala-D-Ala carboxypeptidase n=2 Tax=Rossellomorea aquimaris TaxID=189382 RepID=A0A366ECV3_9BACI|nr:cell elongation-specific peptidoglycan D,D-transpeptidase [Rossellomorea aquimaris]